MIFIFSSNDNCGVHVLIYYSQQFGEQHLNIYPGIPYTIRPMAFTFQDGAFINFA